ncbi:unnamed protein product [Peronospora farinosa]|uniref:Uncharacterized protein n=1 Tax=Peronospora farinosa TaxID=134698 RepID=A0AAV0U9A9_9STRA|nr:unnamed protein product [Peronospora farinosa]
MLGLVDSKQELRRLLIGKSVPAMTQAATAALFKHYLLIRDVLVMRDVPMEFWEGPHILRAVAVYLREPVYVWDVSANDTAHVQRYTFATLIMDNGEAHETGQVEMVSDDVMKIFLDACFHIHVFPVMLLLKHVESHLYGVQHGNLIFEWHAQRGPDMRSRLDSVHEATGFPKLPSVGYDLDSVRAEDSINRKYPPASAHVHSEVYARILRYDDMSQMGAIDARIAGRLHSVNEDVFAEWAQTEGIKHGLPAMDEGRRSWAHATDWLCSNPAAMRQIMALLPFPELAAQACNQHQREDWGEREAFAQQLQMLDRIQEDEENDDRARTMCAEWATICRTADYTEAVVLARDKQRWDKLNTYVDDSIMRSRPLEIPLNHWFTLHVLPHTIREWCDTVMGRAPASTIAVWFVNLSKYNNYAWLLLTIKIGVLQYIYNWEWHVCLHPLPRRKSARQMPTELFNTTMLITEDTVAKAIRACKPGKACGPDHLGNEFYRDYIEELTPILTTLYRQWYEQQLFPASFTKGNIFCLKKSGDSGNPLNYRLLALLNSDYKVNHANRHNGCTKSVKRAN